MVSDLSGALACGVAVELLDRVSGASVHQLLTRRRDAGKQRLTNEFMGEGEKGFPLFGAREDYSHLLRLLDDGEELVNLHLADGSQEFKAESAPDHSGGF